MTMYRQVENIWIIIEYLLRGVTMMYILKKNGNKLFDAMKEFATIKFDTESYI